MWKFLATAIIMAGAVALYLSSKNQEILARPLSLIWRKVGYVCIVISLFLLLISLPVAPAIFFWLFTAITALGLVPFISLWIEKRNS